MHHTGFVLDDVNDVFVVPSFRRHKAGLAKLSLPDKPNTAFIGNWGILGAIRAMQEEPTLMREELRGKDGDVVSVSCFMGRGGKGVEVVIAHKDTLRTQLQQWNLLKAAFARRRTGAWMCILA